MYLKLKKSSIPTVILLDKIDQNQSLTQWLWYITEYTFIKVVYSSLKSYLSYQW